ncbi:MAG TPA: hypothetical protein PLI84_05495 [Ornithinibacter sp.]|nr:hypothetical protein [Ornithinibacter sp.]HPV89774.1 hypothetical protein [Ornithinibacter sp.]
MFDTIGGIPLHPLIVHGVVVLVPLASLLVLLAALSPRIRHWAGILTPITATVALAMVPLATQSGEALEQRVPESALVEEHAELGDSLVFFVLVLAVAAWALWFVDRPSRATASEGASGGGTAGGRSPAMLAVMVLCVIAVLATTVQVVRIGHSGAASVWDGVGQQVVGNGGRDDD